MPTCVAVECSNNTFIKNWEKDVSLFDLPKGVNLRKKWLLNIKHEHI